MNRIEASDEERFRAALEHLAAGNGGWQSSAGAEFLELVGEVLQRKAARIRADVGTNGVMVDPSDVVSEAVMIV
ncbi:MAG: hypothetical protein ACTH2X_07695, partial [Brachybacterium tyrofermentans]